MIYSDARRADAVPWWLSDFDSDIIGDIKNLKDSNSFNRRLSRGPRAEAIQANIL